MPDWDDTGGAGSRKRGGGSPGARTDGVLVMVLGSMARAQRVVFRVLRFASQTLESLSRGQNMPTPNYSFPSKSCVEDPHSIPKH